MNIQHIVIKKRFFYKVKFAIAVEFIYVCIILKKLIGYLYRLWIK